MPNSAPRSRIVYHLVHRNADGQWHLAPAGERGGGDAYPTKDAGIQAGQRAGHAHVSRGERAQLVVHREDGSIETEYTYGDDPHDVPG